jgi:hypothetical protein
MRQHNYNLELWMHSELIIKTFTVIQPVFLKSTPGLQYSASLKAEATIL